MQPARRALLAAQAGRREQAAAIVKQLVVDEFGLDVHEVEIGRDQYSLNSVNGLLSTGGHGEFFFKFHHEEGEEHTLEEFYRGDLLKAAGYPVDVPVFVSRRVGRQILLYARRRSARFADVCLELDRSAGAGGSPGADIRAALEAQWALDDLTRAIYERTFHRSNPELSAAEPIHQLFHRRLVTPGDSRVPGGRARRFFWGADYRVGRLVLSADELRCARWRINGTRYRHSIDALLNRSLELLEPSRLGCGAAVTAHGDAHNANVWWEDGAAPQLTLFDPAFAGRHVPALLAEVKATFHNCLAHPFWLYDPGEAADRFSPEARWSGGELEVTLDWELSPLRAAFLASKAQRIWRPLLARLAASGCLETDWRETLRSALFCCPALVMSLRAGEAPAHNPISSLIGLAVAVMAGSEPLAGGEDVVSCFFDGISPASSP